MASGGRVSPFSVDEPDPEFVPDRYASTAEIGDKFRHRVLLELANLALHSESEHVRCSSAQAFLDRVDGKPKASLTVNPGVPPGVKLREQTAELMKRPDLAAHLIAIAEATAELEA